MGRIHNVHVGSYSPYTNKAAAAWETTDARFHVWIRPDTLDLVDDVLYKNPLDGVVYTDPGYFHTRKLDPTSATHSDTLAAVIAEVKAKGLVEIAISAYEAKEREREAENRERARINRIEEHAPELFDAIKDFLLDHRNGLGPDPERFAALVEKVEAET